VVAVLFLEHFLELSVLLLVVELWMRMGEAVGTCSNTRSALLPESFGGGGPHDQVEVDVIYNSN